MRILKMETGDTANATRKKREQNGVFTRFFKDTWKTRHWFQLTILAATLVTGLRFLIYVNQAAGEGPISVSRPTGVEGFLPIGALISWKRFLLTGVWDDIHPAAMVIFGFAIALSILAHKAFCSWFCPVGTVSEWLWRIGESLFGKNLKLPLWLDIPLRSIKYVLLGFFLWITWTMSARAISAFINTPYYKISDVKMLYFFTRMSILTAVVLAILVIGSLFIKNFWCRYLCPYGALTGLVSLISPFRVRRDIEECIHCGKCSKACPHRIDVASKLSVQNPECSGCLDCVEACPAKGALTFRLADQPKSVVKPVVLGTLILGGFTIIYLTTASLGYLKSSLSSQEVRQLIQIIDDDIVSHPGL